MRADSPITTLAQIKGANTTISTSNLSSLGSMQLQWMHLAWMNISIFADTRMVRRCARNAKVETADRTQA